MKIGLQQLTDGMREQHRNALLALEAKLIETERQRDDLLEALEELVGWEVLCPVEYVEKAQAAIAKARGQE